MGAKAEIEATNLPRLPYHITFTASCLAFFVLIIFFHNHKSMAYVHSATQYSLETPAGWLESMTRTTVHAATVYPAAGGAVTQTALTASTTAVTVAAAAASTSESSGRSMMNKPTSTAHWQSIAAGTLGGHLPQHQQLNTYRTTAPAAALPAATMVSQTPIDRDIELHPQQVAAVVQHARSTGHQPSLDLQHVTDQQHFAELYGVKGPAGVAFDIQQGSSDCPAGTAAPTGATAVVLLADSSSGAAELKHAVDRLLLLYSRGSTELQPAFHLYICLHSNEQELVQLAQQYAVESLGAIKLILHRGSSSSSSTGSKGTSPSHPEHMRTVLHVILHCFQYPSVLLLEDGWKLLPDFFEFFHATRWLLDSDPSLYCISAWNPLTHSSQQQQQHSSSTMYGVQRVDVNPMQAWLFGRATGLQVLKAWPRGTSLDWQQYLQQAGLQFGRQCVTPMVPRIQPVDVQNAAGHVHNVTLPAPGKARFGAGHSGTATDRAMAGAFGYNRRGISRTGAGLGSAAADREQQLMRASAAAQWAGRVPVAVFGGASDTPEAAAAEAAATSDSSASSSDVEAGDVEHQQMHLSAQARTPGSSWASQDLTYVLRDKYSSWLHQQLLAAQPMTAATATEQPPVTSAVRVTYTTADDLSFAAEALALPLTLRRGVHYCYSLPNTPARRHCQDFLPDMACEGVVMARTSKGVPVYLVPWAYITALERASSTSGYDWRSTHTTGALHKAGSYATAHHM